MLLDVKNAVMFGPRGVRHDTNIIALNRRSLTLHRWYSGSLKRVGLFDLPIVRHEEKVEHFQQSQSLVPQEDDIVRLDRGCDLSFLLC